MHNHNARSQHAAIFLAGIATQETIGHWWLGTFGRDMLPMRIGPWTVTEQANIAFMIGWPVILAFLAWYAWFRKERVLA
jgi:hypothetical protein